ELGQEAASAQPFAGDDGVPGIGKCQLEDILCQVYGDSRSMHGGLLPWTVTDDQNLQFGSSKPSGTGGVHSNIQADRPRSASFTRALVEGRRLNTALGVLMGGLRAMKHCIALASLALLAGC